MSLISDHISLVSGVLPSTVRVVGFHGTEAISRPYELEVFFSLRGEDAAELDLEDATGAKARLVVDRGAALPPHVFAGIFAAVELLHQVEEQALFRAVLVPHLWLLGLAERSRVFTKKSVPDILSQIFAEDGVADVELRLSASYPVEEHVCQYCETDLDFVSRWMEREGIFYFFEHGDDGDKLILCDSPSYGADPIGKPVRYHPQLGQDRSAGASFRSFTARHAKLSAKVKVRDYDYAKPALALAGTSPVAADGSGTVSRHGGRFFTPDHGARLAKVRSEELLTRQALYQASGTRSHLRAGYAFALDDHPRAALNRSYLAIETRHHGNQAAGHDAFRELCGLDHDDVYFVEVTAIPATTQFRPESRTPSPRIYGYENATIDGEAASEYAQIDAHGRYKVRFKFDEGGLADGQASTWVRMTQPHGGTVEGFHFPLRKGAEVVVAFLGGDPDRPVIAGVVPNAETPSPVTSSNHTTNVIQTGGRNRLELEDQAGAQRITLSTPHSNTYLRMGAPNDDHNLILSTTGLGFFNVGQDLDCAIGWEGAGSWITRVQDDVDLTVVAGGHNTTVQAGDMNTTVRTGTMTTDVKGLVTENYHRGQYTGLENGDSELYVESGSYRIGTAEDLLLNAGGAVQFLIGGDKSVPLDAYKGLGFLVSVMTDDVKVQTFGGTMDLRAKGDISIGTFDGQGAPSAGDVKIEGNHVEITSRSEVIHDFGAFALTTHRADFTTITYGISNELKLGMFNGLTVGSVNDFQLGGGVSFQLGEQMDIFVGLKASFELSASLECGFGVKLVASAPLEFKTKLVELEEHATAKVSDKPVELNNGGVALRLWDLFSIA